MNKKHFEIISNTLYELTMSSTFSTGWWHITPEIYFLNKDLVSDITKMNKIEYNVEHYLNYMIKYNNLESKKIDIQNFLDVISQERYAYYKFVKICEKINDKINIKEVHHIKIKNYVEENIERAKTVCLNNSLDFKIQEKYPKIFNDEYNINDKFNHIFLVEFDNFTFIYSNFIITKKEIYHNHIDFKNFKTGNFLIVDNFNNDKYKISSFSSSIKNILSIIQSKINIIMAPIINYEIGEGNVVMNHNIEELL